MRRLATAVSLFLLLAGLPAGRAVPVCIVWETPRSSPALCRLTLRVACRTETSIYYDKDCHGQPAARVTSNFVGSRYKLELLAPLQRAFTRDQVAGNGAFLAGVSASTGLLVASLLSCVMPAH